MNEMKIFRMLTVAFILIAMLCGLRLLDSYRFSLIEKDIRELQQAIGKE